MSYDAAIIDAGAPKVRHRKSILQKQGDQLPAYSLKPNPNLTCVSHHAWAFAVIKPFNLLRMCDVIASIQ